MCSSTPARRAARKHSKVSASRPLTMTLRTILIAAAAPVSGPATETFMSSPVRIGSRLVGMRPGEQGRRLVARGMHRRHHGHIDIARMSVHRPRGLLLAARRHRVDIEEILVRPQEWLGLFGGIEARCSSDRSDDQIGTAHRVANRCSAAHADLVRGSHRR